MEPQNSQVLRRPPRHEPKLATSLVECAVQVSPNLARLIRKCAVTEAGGASARNALLASAGLRDNEIEELRRLREIGGLRARARESSAGTCEQAFEIPALLASFQPRRAGK